ncbi:hypothetical protein [Pseudoalteromonas nigrifaciens]|uniref:hypothetical protein n=1 Tax=Pseudoalteromonas nigrifaciens TaxID=28109 RepID=UPI00178820E5|nr:hypothetical protein [Pseudoalteromonas nigrifaciens]MBE0422157.1 hypothetical protein [Pseudoalteromonas nigrifaciens]
MRKLALLLPFLITGCSTYKVDYSVSADKNAVILNVQNGLGRMKIIAVDSKPIPYDVIEKNTWIEVPEGEVAMHVRCDSKPDKRTYKMYEFLSGPVKTYTSYAIRFNPVAGQTYFFERRPEQNTKNQMRPEFISECDKKTYVCEEPKLNNQHMISACNIRIYTKPLYKEFDIDYEFINVEGH